MVIIYGIDMFEEIVLWLDFIYVGSCLVVLIGVMFSVDVFGVDGLVNLCDVFVVVVDLVVCDFGVLVSFGGWVL